MATKALMIRWGTPFPGRERMALEEFSSYVAWSKDLEAKNKIERVEIYGQLSGVHEKISGFSLIEGSEAQIDAIEKSEDFRLRIDRVMSVCHNFGVTPCELGPRMSERMGLYSQALKQLGL